MNIAIDPNAPFQSIASPIGGRDYPRQVVVDFGRPGIRCGIEMRDLIHWTAYRLDTGLEGGIVNHRAAVLLRGVAEEFFPYIDDNADYIAEELQDAGSDDDFKFEDPPVPRVDVRLLGLTDGFVCVGETFAETLWTDEEPHPVLSHNAAATIDFVFPPGVKEKFGIVGIRVCVLDLVCWHIEGARRAALSLEENQEAWLDELATAEGLATAAGDRYQVERVRWFGQRQLTSASPGRKPPSEAEQDQILRELAALV